MSTISDRAADRAPIVQRSRSRSVEQQRAIVDAAARLVLERGSSFTTQDLVKEAGVALKTFYRHFASKDQLLLALMESVIAQQNALFETRGRAIADPLERLRFYVTSTLELLTIDRLALGLRFVFGEYWRLSQVFPEEMAQAMQPYVDLLDEAMREAEAAGALARKDRTDDAWLMSRVVVATLHSCAFGHRDEPVDESAARLWSFCLAGLGGAPQ